MMHHLRKALLLASALGMLSLQTPGIAANYSAICSGGTECSVLLGVGKISLPGLIGFGAKKHDYLFTINYVDEAGKTQATTVGWGAYNATAFGVTLTQEAGNQSVFGYQAKLGVSYLASKNTDVFAEATYQGAMGFTVDNVNYDPLNNWGARVGARYRF